MLSSKLSITAATSLLLALALTLHTTSGQQNVDFSCYENITDYPVDMEKLAGRWYEVFRIPDGDVPECVSADAPSALLSNGSYALEINYMNNAKKKWVNLTETLHFPWTEEASNGNFQLHFGSGLTSITFIYKIMITDYSNIAAVCGYASVAPRVSFFKVFTRERAINDTIKQQINQVLAPYKNDAPFYWVDQSARCSAARVLPYLSVIFAVFLAILSRV